MRRVLNKDEVIVYEFLVPMKEKLDVGQVRLLRCGILPISSPVVGAFLVPLAGLFSLLAFLFLCGCFSESEDSVIYEFVNSAQQQPVCYLTSFFSCTLSSSRDMLHCTLSLTVCTCTPCQ